MNKRYKYYYYVGNSRVTDKYLYRLKQKNPKSLDYKSLCNVTRHDEIWEVDTNAFIKKFVDVSTLTSSDAQEILLKKGFEYLLTLPYDEFSFTNEKLINSTPTQPTENKKMKTDIIAATVDKNVKAAKVAAQLVAGDALNAAVLTKLKPHLPMMVRGYAEHTLAPVLAANIVSFIVSTWASQNVKANWAAEAMMQAAMTDFARSFNIDAIIEDILAGIEIPTE
jgi:hypothetical protein